jgi:AraC-like DNA-binding protein
MIVGTKCGAAACHKADMDAIRECRLTGKRVIYECHAGLVDIAVPLFVNGKFLGCLTCGQVLRRRPTEKTFAEFKTRVACLRLDKARLRKYYFGTPVLSERQIEAMAELVSMIGNYIVESESKLLFLESVNEKSRMVSARKFIERNYQRDISISDIAREVYLSESHFSHQFRKEVGTSAVQYLNRFRIEKAKELLQSNGFNITEISGKTGFQSLPHFNRIFRKFENMSPCEFRKKQKRLDNQQ